MIYLVLASVLWSWSFGLINRQLTDLDPAFIALVRLLIATLWFLPMLRLRRIPAGLWLRLAAIGAVQYGLMYVVYIQAFQYLSGHEIALLTVTTPLLVVLCDDFLKRRFSRLNLLAALLATLGGAYLRFDGGWSAPAVRGIVLMQLANACFAVGQVAYRELLGSASDAAAPARFKDVHGFALMYAGAAATAGLAALASGGLADVMQVRWSQAGALLYLGTVPSGLAFLLWNMGARRVRGGMLACMNNLKIPLAVAVAVLFFGERAAWGRVGVAFAALMLALWAVRDPASGAARKGLR